MLDSAEQRPTLCESEVPKMLSEVNDPFDTLGKSECDRLSPDRGTICSIINLCRAYNISILLLTLDMHKIGSILTSSVSNTGIFAVRPISD